MDETECTAANFMPKDLIEIICILERDEKCHSYKIIQKRKYFTLVTKFPAKNIGITHVFSCINICRVPRMLFEHEADRPTVQHHPRDPASVNAIKINMCDRYSCIFYLIPAQFALKTLLKH